MSGANSFLNYQSAQIKLMFDQVRKISEAAEVTDEDGHWGVDGWIKVIHGLLDLQLRYAAFATESTFKGPWWLKRFPHKPYDSDYVEVACSATYARTITIVSEFRRVGALPQEQYATIPNNLIDIPVVLEAGQTRILIQARGHLDHPAVTNYLGCNYLGTILLSPCDQQLAETRPPEQPQTFTVGL